MPEADLAKYLFESYSVSSITADLNNPSKLFVVATKDDVIIGFVQLTRGTSEPCIDKIDNKIQLQRLYVSDKYQGLGIGKLLLVRAEDEARNMGAKNVWLASWKLNMKAGRIYERAGYARIGEMRFSLGDSQLEDWVMIKSI